MLNIESRDPGIVDKQGTTGQYSQSYRFLATQLALFTEAFFTPFCLYQLLLNYIILMRAIKMAHYPCYILTVFVIWSSVLDSQVTDY